MSSAAIVHSFVADSYCEVAAATLLFFEYFVHLPQEIDLFWKGRLTGASVLFLSNRYLSLLAQVLNLKNPLSDKLCHRCEGRLGDIIAAVLLLGRPVHGSCAPPCVGPQTLPLQAFLPCEHARYAQHTSDGH
ncbi:hypothetical protein L226DRAFT_347266 [Lentinus tigrinus ALCF2SS1-7]|uniref:uncharacterized protein n=1 Tax=Lentinus tigrinus ALCF2SS1-7 TaxID=1328758 RepID=UPI0011662275|nr:hypothetical protein L226DRAFT_347266 [Lentinus tigrinus ALCF2SS1-7]